MTWKIIGAKKVTIKGEKLISLRIQKITPLGAKVTTNLHIEPIPDYKKLIGTEI